MLLDVGKSYDPEVEVFQMLDKQKTQICGFATNRHHKNTRCLFGGQIPASWIKAIIRNYRHSAGAPLV